MIQIVPCLNGANKKTDPKAGFFKAIADYLAGASLASLAASAAGAAGAAGAASAAGAAGAASAAGAAGAAGAASTAGAAGGVTTVSSFLLQAAKAIASRDAINRDFFMNIPSIII
jgi:hypothetical protein